MSNDDFDNRYDDNMALKDQADKRAARIRRLEEYIDDCQKKLAQFQTWTGEAVQEIERKELAAHRELRRLR